MTLIVDLDVERFARLVRNSGFVSVQQVARALTRLYDEALAPLRLRVSDLGILRLCAAGPLSARELARAVEVSPRMVRRGLNPLIDRGLLVKLRVAGRRERLLALTPVGQRRLLAGLERWTWVQRRLVEILGEDRWESLGQQLAALTDATQ